MFTQIGSIARFGNAQLSQSDDWVKVVPTSSSATWVAGTGSAGECKDMLIGYRYEIIHSRVGFKNNL